MGRRRGKAGIQMGNMNNALTQAAVYLALLAAGYGCKRAGLFRVEDSDFIRSAILYITMPAVAVNGLAELTLQPSFLWCFLAGLAACAVLIAIGLLSSRRAPLGDRLAYLFSMSNFNIGNFAIPFLTGLVSDDGFVALCLFDIAVAISLYGVCCSLAEGLRGRKGGFSLKLLAAKLFTSPVTDAYLVMLALAALGLRLPGPVLRLAQVAANANAFLAMISIGILFEFRFRREDLGAFVRFFLLRYGTAVALAAAVILLLPLPADIRQAVCVLLMAPVGSVGPLLTRNTGGNTTLAAQLNSISIPIGIVMMVLMYAVTGAMA